MHESDFHAHADHTLEQLVTSIEKADHDDQLDVDYIDSVLTVTLEDDREFVINKHAASQQIWLSSPVSGADYFSFHTSSEEWRNKEGVSLLSQLSSDLLGLACINEALS